jgi:type II secretion system protein N
LEEARPDLILSYRKLLLSFPVGLDLRHVDLFLRESRELPVFSADRFSLSPQIISLFRKTPEFRVRGHSYGGDLKGLFHFEDMEMSGPFMATLDLKDLNIGRYTRLSKMISHEISGILSGHLQYRNTTGDWIEGWGDADLNISEGAIDLREPILGLSAIKFDQISAVAALEKRRIVLKKVAFTGPALKGYLKGEIFLRHNLNLSSLNLKGSLEPLGGALNGLKDETGVLKMLRQGFKGLKRDFVIRGTLSLPVFRFT